MPERHVRSARTLGYLDDDLAPSRKSSPTPPRSSGGAVPVAIRRLVADDAQALSKCFERCYGRWYVVAEFYDPGATAARIASGSLR